MGGSGTGRTMARGMLMGLALVIGLGSGPGAGQPLPVSRGGDAGRLERRWNELDRQIRALEELLPTEVPPPMAAPWPGHHGHRRALRP
jgi:OMF family outer membrane factor